MILLFQQDSSEYNITIHKKCWSDCQNSIFTHWLSNTDWLSDWSHCSFYYLSHWALLGGGGDNTLDGALHPKHKFLKKRGSMIYHQTTAAAHEKKKNLHQFGELNYFLFFTQQYSNLGWKYTESNLRGEKFFFSTTNAHNESSQYF